MPKEVAGIVLAAVLILIGAVYGGTFAIVLYVVGLSLAFISVIVFALFRDGRSR